MTDPNADPVPACFVCRCEEVTEDEILEVIADGARGINDVKRRTRAGMGLCQGIFCVRPIAELLRGQLGLSPAEIAPMTARPPVRPIPLEQLAASEE